MLNSQGERIFFLCILTEASSTCSFVRLYQLIFCVMCASSRISVSSRYCSSVLFSPPSQFLGRSAYYDQVMTIWASVSCNRFHRKRLSLGLGGGNKEMRVKVKLASDR